MALNYVLRTVVAHGQAYLNDLVMSPTNKYASLAAPGGNWRILVRNDGTGNYDTAQIPSGTGAVGVTSCIWGAADAWCGIAATNGWMYFATRNSPADTFTYQNGFNAGHGALRDADVHPSNETIWATAGGNSTVKFWSVTRASAAATVLLTTTLNDSAESIKFSPDGNWAAACSRAGSVYIFSVVGTTITLVQTLTGGMNWHIDWHPSSDHFVGGNNLNANGIKVVKKTGSTFAVMADPFTGGRPTFSAIGVEYITGGRYLHIQGTTAADWRVYERVGDVYNNVTGTVTGYTGLGAYNANANTGGSALAIAGSGSTYSIYVTPVDSGEQVTSVINIAQFTMAGSLKFTNLVTSASVLAPFTLDGTGEVAFGAYGTLVTKAFTGQGFINAADEDIISLRPITMTPGSAFVSAVTPTPLINNSPAPYLYGIMDLPSFTMDAFVRHPLEVRASTFVLSGYTTDGMIKWAIVPEPAALVLQAFTASAEVLIAEGQVVGAGYIQAFTATGEVTVPWGSIGSLSTASFISDGYARFGYKTNGAMVFPGFVSDGLLFTPISAESILTLSAYRSDALLEKDNRPIEASLAMSGFTAAGEVHVDFGMIGALSLTGFTSSGFLDVPMFVRGAMQLPAFQAEIILDRPTTIDANFSLKPFTASIFVSFPLDNTGQLRLQPFTAQGEATLISRLTGALILNQFIAAGEGKMGGKKVNANLMVPQFTSSGLVSMWQSVTSTAVFPKFVAVGELLSTNNAEGSPMLMAYSADGQLVSIMYRRQLRIVMDTFA